MRLQSSARGAELLTPEFTTDLSGFYNVSLMFAPLHVELEECLVGDSLFSNFCQGRTDRLVLDWTVLRQSANGETPVMAYQPYRPGSFEGAGSVETVLGGFEAHKGSVYRIGVRVKEIAPELASASPRVHVEAHGIYWEKWVIYAQMSFLLAIVVELFGIAFLLWGLLPGHRKIPIGG